MKPHAARESLEFVGAFSITDLRWFIGRFEAEHMTFRVAANEAALKTMATVGSPWSGTCAAGLAIELYVVDREREKAAKILADYASTPQRVRPRR